MKTFIALLRGINVGGHHKIPMVELRELCKNLGLDNVRSYIQTGNVIFESSDLNGDTLEHLIKKGIKDQFGFDIPVLIKTPKDIETIIEACPFIEEKQLKSYFMIFNKKPDNATIEELNQIEYPGEEFVITPLALYFYCATGYARVKFNMSTFERKLEVTATSRNYNTMMKLLSLSEDKTA